MRRELKEILTVTHRDKLVEAVHLNSHVWDLLIKRDIVSIQVRKEIEVFNALFPTNVARECQVIYAPAGGFYRHLILL